MVSSEHQEGKTADFTNTHASIPSFGASKSDSLDGLNLASYPTHFIF